MTQILDRSPAKDRLRLTAKAAEQWLALDVGTQDRLRPLLRRISGGEIPGDRRPGSGRAWQVALAPDDDRVATFERRDDLVEEGDGARGPVYVASLADHAIALVRDGDDLIIAGIQ
jgi:hypothetical protein